VGNLSELEKMRSTEVVLRGNNNLVSRIEEKRRREKGLLFPVLWFKVNQQVFRG